MTYNNLLELAKKVNYLAVQSYLLNTGWKKEQQPRTDIALFHRDADSLSEIVLPMSKELFDYDKTIINAIRILSEIEKVDVEEKLIDLLLPPSDTVKFRVANDETKEGTILLNNAFILFENLKKALFATACDIVKPEPYHKRLSYAAATNFINQCRFGQTQHGSFIASIHCPFISKTNIEEEPQQLTLFSNEEDYRQSFTRQVTTQMMQALHILKTSIETASIEKIISQETEVKMSANFLEAIVDVNQFNTDGEIEIKTEWAPISRVPNIPQSIKFTQEYIPAIEGIISKMTPVDTGETGEFVGKISQVKAEPDASKRIEGEITFNFIGDEGNVSKAKVILNSDDYKKACEAHEDGKNVIIKGLLKKVGKSKVIESPSFEIVQGS